MIPRVFVRGRGRAASRVAAFAVLAVVAAGCTTSDDSASTTAPAPADTSVPGPGGEPPSDTNPAVDDGTGGDGDRPGDTDTGDGEDSPRLVVWADELRANVFEEAAGTFRDATGVEVVVERLDIADIRTGLEDPSTTALGVAPDLFVGPSTWTGELADAGLVVPIDLGGRQGDLVQTTLDAFTHGGAIYGAPYAADALVLYVNTDIVDVAPGTLDELIATCEAIEASTDGSTGDAAPADDTSQTGTPTSAGCVGLPGGGSEPEAYHQYPFLAAFGGGVLAFDSGQGFSLDTPLLGSDASIAGIDLLDDLIDEGIINPTSYEDARTNFASGRTPFFITGPWELGPLGDEDLAWTVVALPTLEEGRLASPVTAQGVFVGGQSNNPVIAQTFITDFILTEGVLAALHGAEARPSPLRSIAESEADDRVRAAFNQAVATGAAFPNVAGLDPVWNDLADGLALMHSGQASPPEAVQPALERLTALSGTSESDG